MHSMDHFFTSRMKTGQIRVTAFLNITTWSERSLRMNMWSRSGICCSLHPSSELHWKHSQPPIFQPDGRGIYTCEIGIPVDALAGRRNLEGVGPVATGMGQLIVIDRRCSITGTVTSYQSRAVSAPSSRGVQAYEVAGTRSTRSTRQTPPYCKSGVGL